MTPVMMSVEVVLNQYITVVTNGSLPYIWDSLHNEWNTTDVPFLNQSHVSQIWAMKSLNENVFVGGSFALDVAITDRL